MTPPAYTLHDRFGPLDSDRVYRSIGAALQAAAYRARAWNRIVLVSARRSYWTVYPSGLITKRARDRDREV